MLPIQRIAVFGLCFACPLALRADFTYQETTQITGGSIVGLMKMAGAFSSQARKADQPVTSSVFVKGNQMARVYPDHMEIIDLDRDTITEVDTVKHTYSVMTFEQMKQQIEQAQQEAQKKQASAPAQGQPQPTQASNVDMSFDVHVRKTGATQQISGMDTQEAILTMAMVATNKTTQEKGSLGITDDIWAAPEMKGYDEVRAFEQRYALKLGRTLGSSSPGMSALFAQPGAAQGMKGLAKEMSELKGVPIMQVMRMGSTADGKALPAASEAPLPATTGPALPSAGDVAKQTATSVLANKLGGLGGGLGSGLGSALGGFGRHKKAAVADAAQQTVSQAASEVGQAAGDAVTHPSSKANGSGSAADANAQAASGAAASVLIESHTTMSGFSTASLDASHFSVPAGYQQVTPQALQHTAQ